MSIIHIPTIKSDDSGFEKILKIFDDVIKDPIDYFFFDFKHCSKISHNGVVILGGLSRFIAHQKITSSDLLRKRIPYIGCNFLVESMSSVVSQNLIRNNFLSYFSPLKRTDENYPEGEYIGYREHDITLDDGALAQHLEAEWLSDDKLKLSEKLKQAIISRIIEIFMNAYGHGIYNQKNSKLKIYSCGEYDKKNKKLHISVLDFGAGIVKTVQECTKIENEIDAMYWALQQGNSTNTDSSSMVLARGLGFELLRQFVAINKGELRIYSNTIKVCTDKNGEYKISKMEQNFPGTFVSITINCDGNNYCFSSEKIPSETFY